MKRIIILSFFGWSQLAIGQSLETKWNRMLDKANTYNSHKIIKTEDLRQMYGSIHDSLLMAGVRFKHEQKQVSAQKEEIALLKKKENEAQNNLINERLEKEKAISSRLAADWYIISLWIALGTSLLASAFMYFLYKRSNTITFQKIKDHEELAKSFSDYKAEKMEVERKLKREIQTYANHFHEPKPRF